MKIHLLVPAAIVTLLILNQGCDEKKAINELFAGTLPVLEITEDGSTRVTSPSSLFIRMLDNFVEMGGENYPIERISESKDKVIYKTRFSLTEGLTVTGVILLKTEHKLVLELDDLQRTVTLEPFDLLMHRKVNEFAEVDLTADISHFTDSQKEMLRLLFQVANLMDEIYWTQVFPQRDMVMDSTTNHDVSKFFEINYGPWERLNGNLPFLPGYGAKPAGSGYYPPDMSRQEFDLLDDPAKSNLYTLITRKKDGSLQVVPYHVAYAEQVQKAANLLIQAARLAKDEGFRNYLELRAQALLTDDYFASDMAWMDLKTNEIDFVVGPIENYEDALFNYKAAHESFLLIKDQTWSERLDYIRSVLPKMQKSLPVPEAYKQELPGSNSDLGAYDVVYYSGDCNAGSKTIAINLPNDERVQATKGSRKLQLKNVIRYKFEEILVPISNVLIAEEQREHVTFDAFFENTMYHEVAHGLGLNQTINGSGTVRSALQEQYSALEEGKADILALYLITSLYEDGLLGERDLMDNYVTFMASIFRSIRFGVASAHGKANMIRFYYFQEMGAFTHDVEKGTYRINFKQMQNAMNHLGNLILTIQGDGNHDMAKRLVDEKGFIRKELQADLNRLRELNIPVDIVFNQGPQLLGL